MSQYLDRFPVNRNLLSPVGFKFALDKAPKVDFLSNYAGIPAITLGSALQTRYGKNIDIPGDKMNFEDFRLRFLVDENMENYMEIWNWMTGLGFPYSLEQYSDLRDNSELYNSPALKGDFYERSDGTLNILNSNFNVQSKVIFEGLYPVYLSALDFDATLEDIRYFTAEVTFKYTYYRVITQLSKPKVVPIILPPAPTVSLTANKTTSAANKKIRLSWNSTNATKLSISGIGEVDRTSGYADVLFPGGTVTYTITATGVNGTATDSVTITSVSAATADYFVITYGFTDGSDLDTRTSITSPSGITGTVGWAKDTTIGVPAYVTWGGDNTGTGVESFLFDKNTFKAANPGISTVTFDLRCGWYGSIGSQPVVINVTSYAGGTMTKTGYTWNNPTADHTYVGFTSTSAVITQKIQNGTDNGQRVALMTLDFEDGVVGYSTT